MSVLSLNSNSAKAKAEISNHEADPLSCKHCPVRSYEAGKYCDEFQEKGRCIRAALVNAINTNRVTILIRGCKDETTSG